MLSIDAVFTNDLEDPSSFAFLKLQERLQNRVKFNVIRWKLIIDRFVHAQ